MAPSFSTKTNKRPELWWPDVREEALKIVARLRQVWIRRLPWEDCIKRFDRASSFFYLDPPYRAAGAKAYRHYFTDEDHARLADWLVGRVKGRWLLSYNDDPFLRRLYRGRRIHIREVECSCSAPKAQRKRVHELLIANYPIGGGQ